jgi:hypothetical protein
VRSGVAWDSFDWCLASEGSRGRDSGRVVGVRQGRKGKAESEERTRLGSGAGFRQVSGRLCPSLFQPL